MNDRDLMLMPADEQRGMMLRRETSSVDLTQAALRRISALDNQLNAFITVDSEGAMATAMAADARLAGDDDARLLEGVPVCVKDLELTAGLKTTLGCAEFADWVPDYDSIVVERLRAAGAVILGKTNTPEFGNSAETYTDFFPEARNPWDPARHPGGSSGGTSAAIASGMCSLGTGSDGGGSVRLPAAFTGIFGHKPTHGRVPRYGGRSQPSYNCTSTTGPMSQDVRSSAIMHAVISGYDSRDPGSLSSPVPDCLSGLEDGIEGMSIAYSPDLGYANVDDDVATACESALAAFENAGAKVKQVEVTFDVLPATYWWTVWTAGQVAMYGALSEEPGVKLTDYTMEMINAGRSVTGADYARALRQAQVHRVQMDELFSEYDLLVTPTTATVAWPHRQPPRTLGGVPVEKGIANPSAVPFTALWNILWNPAASVPCGFGQAGMPIGLQLIGACDDDPTVFRAARAFERERPWDVKRPQVS